MPPQIRSRFIFTTGFDDADSIKLLSEREPFRFQQFSDTRIHTVKEGDKLFNLAGRFFRPLARSAGLWWIIADFQPAPIVDPTIELILGQQLVIPSVPTVLNIILGEQQRRRT